MEKRTIISGVILIVFCVVLGVSTGITALWITYLTHWIILPTVALVLTLLVGMVLMDDIFELDKSLVITLRKPKVMIEIKQYLVWAVAIVGAGGWVVEAIQLFLVRSTVNWRDPLLIFAGAVAGIVLHIIGSRWLMKKVEFELERWEDNVL